jgi:hypothetical protein
MVVVCGSQTKRYVPAESVTVQVCVPVNETAVAAFTPGPERWKLWMLDRSRTSITYLPGVRC